MDKKLNIHKVLLKPTWGRMSVSPGNLLNLSADILEKASDFYQRGGKLFIIQYAPEQDLLGQMILGSLFTRFLNLKKEVKLFLPDVEFSRSTEILSTEFLLVHNLPQFPETLALLAENNQNQIIIATGATTHWEQAKIDIPVFYYQPHPSPKPDWREYFEIDFKREFEIYQSLNPTEKAIFERVVAMDSLGIPVPIDLLANSLNLPVKDTIDSVTDIKEKGLLECLKDEKQAELLVCSNSTQLARKLIEIESWLTKPLETAFTEVINSVENENKDERYTILNLFQSALGNSLYSAKNKILSRPKLRELIHICNEKFAEMWSAGDEIEHLLWGKILEELQMFEQSAEVFAAGLGKNKNNPYLKQAQARMIGRWSLVDPAKRKLADEIFKQLTNDTAGNPYFLQARGVFESARNEPRAARDYFKSALNVADGEENKAYILTAWANLEIEQGNFETAEELLGQISEASKSPYIPHILAKLNFYRGDYQKAFEKLKELFSIRPLSVKGWNLLGETALRRAHWRTAETALKIASSINPENALTLRALGDLETELGKFESGNKNSMLAQIHFQAARRYFAQVLEIEPLNLNGQVSTSVLLRDEGKLLQRQEEPEQAKLFFETAVQNLSEVYQKYPFNEFITHNLGETYLAAGNYQEAKKHFAETGSLAGLVGLAKAEIGLGNSELAIEYLDSAEERLKESSSKQYERVRALNSLAAVWITLEDLPKAESLGQTSFELDGENGFTLRLLAKIGRLSGRESNAILFEKKARDLASEELGEFLLEKS